MTSVQWNALPREKTVFFFSVGPLEDHGPHLPIGLDLEEAMQLCRLTAEHLEKMSVDWQGVLMPKTALGIESNTTKMALTVRPYVLRDWLIDSCEALMRLGFVHFVCFSGHLGPKQLTAIEEAGKWVYRRGGLKYWMQWITHPLKHPHAVRASLVSASSIQVSFQTVLKSPFWPDPKEHGGARDTSIALSLDPSDVDSNWKQLPLITSLTSQWARNLQRKFRKREGYWGNPALAQAHEGKKELHQWVESLYPKLQAVWAGTHPNRLFRSWYSILPLNKSFFKSWFLFFCILMMLLGGWFLHSLTLSIE